MKTYKNKFLRYISAFVIVLTAMSCETIETDLTEDPNNLNPSEADLSGLINSSQLGFNAFFQGLQYDLSTVTRMELMNSSATYANQFSIDNFNSTWTNAYANCLIELKQVKEIAASLDSENANGDDIAAMAQIMEAYVIVTLVDTFNDVPYSEALQGGANLNPGRDSGEFIYAEAKDLLEDAITKINSPNSVSIPSDLIYDGDEQKWKALANSLLLKIAVASRLNNPDAQADASAVINANDFISDNSGDFQFNYSNNSDPESRHPLFTIQYVGGASLYMSQSWLNRMSNDPRFNYYFYQQDGPGGYEGRFHGDTSPNVGTELVISTVHGLYPAGGKYNDGTTGATGPNDGAGGEGSSIIMTNAFTQFLIAEAQLMLNGNSGAARNALIAGVTSSIQKVVNYNTGQVPAGTEATQADIDAYISSVGAAYDAAGSENERLDVIIKEYYKSAWGNGVEIYNNFRRTSYPSDLVPSQDSTPGSFTHSMLYPSIYISNNNNPDATQKSSIAEKVWWAEGTSFNLDY